MYIGTIVEEELHNVHMAILCRKPERHIVIVVRVGAVLYEEPNNIGMTVNRCCLECNGRDEIVHAVSAVVDEELHNVCVAKPGCQYQGRVVILRNHHCAVLDEESDCIHVAEANGREAGCLHSRREVARILTTSASILVQHALQDSHVAGGPRADQATEVRCLQLDVCSGRRVSPPGIQSL